MHSDWFGQFGEKNGHGKISAPWPKLPEIEKKPASVEHPLPHRIQSDRSTSGFNCSREETITNVENASELRSLRSDRSNDHQNNIAPPLSITQTSLRKV